MSGSWYSTTQVGYTVTRARDVGALDVVGGRRANQVENRCLAYGGSSRTAETPVARAVSLRSDDPDGERAIRLTIRLVDDPMIGPMIGVVDVASFPSRSVWLSIRVVADPRVEAMPSACCIALARSISRGKSTDESSGSAR